MPLSFEHPSALLILALALPLAFMAWRSAAVLGPVKAWGGLLLRIAVLFLLTFALSQPSWVRESDAMSVLVVADASDSVPLALRKRVDVALVEAVKRKEKPEDRVGVVTVARGATIGALPNISGEVATLAHAGDLQATDLAAGISTALATRPADTTARIVLASDGNETVGSLLAAADTARAAGTPIDVIPLEYSHDNEVLIESVHAPARAREGQSLDLRVSIRTQRPMTGMVLVWQNDEPVDLDPTSDSLGQSEELKAGPNLIRIPVVAQSTGAQRFRVTFQPDDPTLDTVGQNNAGAAVVYVGGTGSVLIIDASGGMETDALNRALTNGEITVTVSTPETAALRGIADLAGFDAVIVANMPRWAIDNEFDRALHAYVHDLGGGLLILGGPESFGAGGWLGSETAKAMPVKLDPPQTRQVTRGALAILLHACEMPEGNHWGMKVSEAAIGALSSEDYLGLISLTGGWNDAGANQGFSWSYPMQKVGDKRKALEIARTMTVGDMPSFGPPMEMILDSMSKLRAGQKHTIIISDGDPSAPPVELLNDFRAAKITVTTVLITGSLGHGSQEDNRKMQAIAEKTGGRFWRVEKSSALPQIFIQEATMVSRSLIVEGDFNPAIAPQAGGPMVGYSALPLVRGYILTVPREGLAQISATLRNEKGNDPLYAFWNYGLGRSIAFTSDVTGRWGGAWQSWPQFQAFWEQSVRWLMRPATPQDVGVSTRLDGDRAFIDVEMRDQQAAGFSGVGHAVAQVIGPDGLTMELPLRQTGPGRFTGEFDTPQAGAYLANIAFVRAGKDGEEGRKGTVQAAVSVPYPAEYRSTRDNSSLLRAVAERTGGRVLRLDDAKVWDLFDRTTLGTSMAAKDLWGLAAILAAILLLIDVAWRRLAFDTRDARELAQRVTGGAVTAGAAGTGGVDALRRARARGAAPADPATTARRFEAGETRRVDAVRDLGIHGDDSQKDSAHTPEKTGPEDDPLTRLRAARKRAQDQTDGPQSEGPDQTPPGGGKTP